jgi:AraC-like DNA-binding protein
VALADKKRGEASEARHLKETLMETRHAAGSLVGTAASTSNWTTATLPDAEQFAAWRSVIVDAHLPWDIPRIRCERFPAFMRQFRQDGVRITHCSSPDTVSGVRTRGLIAREGACFLNVVHIAEGIETLRFGHTEVQLGAGMFTLWDSARPMQFTTRPGLRQMTLMVPAQQLRRRIPRVDDLVGAPMDGRSGLGGLFIDHLNALERRIGELPPHHSRAIIDGTLDLLALCLGAQHPAHEHSLRAAFLERIQRHIDQHLTDPALTVGSIAQAHRITERYLHKLFEDTGITVGQWIRQTRLERCRRDLASDAMSRRHITEVAYHWGFSDSSHFSRLFKQAYGLSPRAFRESARLAGAGTSHINNSQDAG